MKYQFCVYCSFPLIAFSAASLCFFCTYAEVLFEINKVLQRFRICNLVDQNLHINILKGAFSNPLAN